MCLTLSPGSNTRRAVDVCYQYSEQPIEIGDYVAVIGAGFMGLLVVHSRQMSVRELIALDFIDERLDWKFKNGSDYVIN